MRTFGESLKLLRNERKLTQKQVAEIFSLTERAYQNYELNKSTPNVKLLIEIADFFNVSLDYLVGRSDER